MSTESQPIAVDEAYRIRDTQLWYTDCSFAELIRNKKTIVLNIRGLGIRTFEHSITGNDGRPTYSYKMISKLDSDRIWWNEHRGKPVRIELLAIDEEVEFKPDSNESSITLQEIKIIRGYEVLSDNTIRFGLRITNNTDAVITDVHVLLEYNDSLLNLHGDRVQKLDSVPPNIPRTAKFILKPLGCVHKEDIEATISYRDHKWEKHVVMMKPKEIHCVCPFLRSKPVTKAEFFALSNKGHSIETGINFQGINSSHLKSFLLQTCTNRLHKVDEYSIDGDNILYFSSESVGEKAYYLLTVLIKEQDGLTQVMLRAASDKTHGIYGFLNEIVSELKYMVHTVSSTKEIGVIKHEHVINIIDSVVQRSSFSIDSGTPSLNVKDSVVQRSDIDSSSNTTNIQDSIVQKTTVKTNAQKKGNEEIARIAHQEHEDMKHRKEKKKAPLKQKESKRTMIVSLLAILLIGGLWFGLSGNNDNSDSFSVQEITREYEVLVNVSVVNSTNENNTSISYNPINDELLIVGNAATDTTVENTTDEMLLNTGQQQYSNSIGMEFVQIPTGTFEMGDNYGPGEEHPVHEVTIGYDFYLGKYEVTQEQWFTVMGDNPSRFRGDNNPVEGISWDDAQEFIDKLNEIEDTDKYRLPSEAEWEYACRAGTTTKYSHGDSYSGLSDYAWYSSNSETSTHPVGQKECNLWGLYDMYGNVNEWVQDRYHVAYKFCPIDGSSWDDYSPYGRVIRGGSWSDSATNCRSASRSEIDENHSGTHNIGIRVVIDI